MPSGVGAFLSKRAPLCFVNFRNAVKIMLKFTIRLFIILAPLTSICLAQVQLENPDIIGEEEQKIVQTRQMMGTWAEITVYSQDVKSANIAIDSAFDAMTAVNGLMSAYNQDSEISEINRQAGKKPVSVSPQTFFVVKSAIYYSEISDGAFDITISPLVRSWGFFRKQGRIPPQEEIDQQLALVNYKLIELDSERNRIKLLKNGMALDLGGIAKGYAVDQAIEKLRASKVENVLVNLSGNMYAMGHPKDKEAWHIGIRHPRQKDNLLGFLKLKEKAIATSGDYEKYFIHEGKRYSHIINPRTGHPVSGIASVTIIAPTAMKADALSTAVFVLGAEKGFQLIKSKDGVEGIIVQIDDKEELSFVMSEGFKKRFISY
ncbi:TPA: FAD:protein FMN transferase [Candidatus Poribacteria bacterium]|nr:FAD:protein FMN transferase [Candidatus Poribacteria bacterium]